MDVINRIEELREERGWTKYRLAEEAMILYSTLAGIYSRGTPPKIDTLENICHAFGITLAQFFTDEETEIINENEKLLLKLYRKLDADKKQAILTLIDGN
ncbi:MAG: helix-turn-helix transcriptional regulator [Clostridiales bacterium]|nr:helix-turn-helix transcriptional regulator [Clostridiales bacterium]